MSELVDRLRLGRKTLGWLLLPGVVVIILGGVLLSGNSGFVEVQPGEVAVVYNTWFDTETPHVSIEQGTLGYLPFFQRVEILDKRPQVLLMEGDQDTGVNHVRTLTVRANDGSNFWFDRVEIHYQIIPEQAAELIAQNGVGDGYKENAVATHARQVLRDEFGRYDFTKIADPTTYGLATSQARDALNRKLNELGFMVTQIPPSKPRFREEVEAAIEDRQNAEQEVEVQKEKRERLTAQSKRLVQEVTEKKNNEYQMLLATLEGQRKESENTEIAVKRAADMYHIDRTATCEAERDARVAKAKANEEAAADRAAALASKIAALGAQGPAILNLEIAKTIMPQMQRVQAAPYVAPSTPTDVRLLPFPANAGGNR